MDPFAPVVTICATIAVALDLARWRQALRFGSGSGAEKEERSFLSLPTGNEKETGMRQLYPRASRLRFFLVVAVISVITLAASSPIYPAARGGHLIGHTSESPAAAAAGTGATADCSKATALELTTRFHLAVLAAGDSVAQWFCGAFVGPGSQAMVIATTPGTCGLNGWAVLSFTGGDWQLVGSPHIGWTFAVTAVGPDIRETAPVPTGKFQCPLNNGTPRSRIWHWDGTHLVAGPWKQVTPPKSSTGATLHLYVFASPSRNILCRLGDEDLATCLTVKPPRSVHMSRNGHLNVCGGTRCIGTGRFGAVPRLGYGKKDAYAGYLCRSQKVGVTCTDTKSGKGFLISKSGVRRVGS